MQNLRIVVLVGLLVGCSKLDGEEIQIWNDAGYQLGLQGKARTVKVAEELKNPRLLDAYDAGYKKGLAVFCDPAKAYQYGVEGNYYSGICEPEADAKQFQMEWQRGWNEYSSRATYQ